MSNAKNTKYAPDWKVRILAHSKVPVMANYVFPCGTHASDMAVGFRLLIFKHNEYGTSILCKTEERRIRTPDRPSCK